MNSADLRASSRGYDGRIQVARGRVNFENNIMAKNVVDALLLGSSGQSGFSIFDSKSGEGARGHERKWGMETLVAALSTDYPIFTHRGRNRRGDVLMHVSASRSVSNQRRINLPWRLTRAFLDRDDDPFVS